VAGSPAFHCEELMRDRLNSSRLLGDGDDPSSLQTLAASGLHSSHSMTAIEAQAVTRACLAGHETQSLPISKSTVTKGYSALVCRSDRDRLL